MNQAFNIFYNKIIKMTSITIDSFGLDLLELNSPPHQRYLQLQTLQPPYFPSIIGTRSTNQLPQSSSQRPQSSSNQEQSIMIQLITSQKLYPFELNKLSKEGSKTKLCFLSDYMEALDLIDSKDLTIGVVKNQEFLYLNSSNQLRFKYYFCQPKNSFEIPKLQPSTLAQYAIQLSYTLPNNLPRPTQPLLVWRWGSLAAQLLYNFNTQGYITKLLNHKQLIDESPVLQPRHSFPNQKMLLNLIERSLKMMPQLRPSCQQIRSILRETYKMYRSRPMKTIMGELKSRYLKNKEKNLSQFKISINEETQILTDTLKKKVVSQFIKLGQKPPKEFKILFIADRFNFDNQILYQYITNKANLLFVFDTIPEKQGSESRICAFIAPTLRVKDEQGLFGHEISDPKLESFIYSVKNQQSYKLMNKQQCFRYCPGYGPIIGDGDIIIKGQDKNKCLFPKSFMIGKHKNLPVPQEFAIKNYEIYHIAR